MDWLKTEILVGFQKLICLSLDRQPAAELIPGTAAAWLEAITTGRAWDCDRDRPRIRQAFVNLAKHSRAWPTPRDFDEALPKLDSPSYQLPQLPRRPRSNPEHVRRCLAEMAKSLGRELDAKAAKP